MSPVDIIHQMMLIPRSDLLSSQTYSQTHLCKLSTPVGTTKLIARFKRVGPNAMRGRGIGAARGRATIQRGMSTRCPLLSTGLEADNIANARRGTSTRTPQGVRR
jgi:hypothetical protein